MNVSPMAHCRRNEPGAWMLHSLEEHLRKIAKPADRFAAPFEAGDWATLAGLWHDLGKYRRSLQGYIRSRSGSDPEVHIEGSQGRVDHSTVGAIHAVERLANTGGSSPISSPDITPVCLIGTARLPRFLSA